MSEKQNNSRIVETIDESKSLAIKDACVRLLPNCAKGTDVIVSPTQFGCNGATFKANVNGSRDYIVRLLNEGWIAIISGEHTCIIDINLISHILISLFITCRRYKKSQVLAHA